MSDHLLPSRRDFPIDDAIFALHAEAQERKASGESILDVTLGTLTDDRGRLVVHESVLALWHELTPEEVSPYAPIAGDPAFLKGITRWHWPSSPGSGPACATPGGSGALALSLRCFLHPGMSVLTAEPFWGPYATLASEHGVTVVGAPAKVADRPLDLDAWQRAGSILMARQGRLLVWLNDPCHNPTGLSFSREDRQRLMDLLRRWAERGPVTLVLDVAYVDYTADPAHVREALDDYQTLGREGMVLVGAALSLSKSLTLYGVRGGALVFPWAQEPALQGALTQGCRGLWSTAPRPPQALFLRLLRDGKRQEQLLAEQRHWSDILEARALALDGALKERGLEGATWDGGFFVTLRDPEPTAVAERLRSLGVYVVPVASGLRVGLCAMPAEAAPRLAQALAEVR